MICVQKKKIKDLSWGGEAFLLGVHFVSAACCVNGADECRHNLCLQGACSLLRGTDTNNL